MPSDIPVHGQFIDPKNLKSQDWLDGIEMEIYMKRKADEKAKERHGGKANLDTVNEDS